MIGPTEWSDSKYGFLSDEDGYGEKELQAGDIVSKRHANSHVAIGLSLKSPSNLISLRFSEDEITHTIRIVVEGIGERSSRRGVLPRNS